MEHFKISECGFRISDLEGRGRRAEDRLRIWDCGMRIVDFERLIDVNIFPLYDVSIC
jgi:hypothetical protein